MELLWLFLQIVGATVFLFVTACASLAVIFGLVFGTWLILGQPE